MSRRVSPCAVVSGMDHPHAVFRCRIINTDLQQQRVLAKSLTPPTPNRAFYLPFLVELWFRIAILNTGSIYPIQHEDLNIF